MPQQHYIRYNVKVLGKAGTYLLYIYVCIFILFFGYLFCQKDPKCFKKEGISFFILMLRPEIFYPSGVGIYLI